MRNSKKTQTIAQNGILKSKIAAYLQDTLDTPVDLVNALIIIKLVQNGDFDTMEFIRKGLASLSDEKYVNEIFSSGFAKEFSLAVSLIMFDNAVSKENNIESGSVLSLQTQGESFPLAELSGLGEGNSHE